MRTYGGDGLTESRKSRTEGGGMDEQEHRGTPEILEEDERQGLIDGLRSADAGQRALSAAYLGHPSTHAHCLRCWARWPMPTMM